MPAGRPKLYDTPEQMAADIQVYFESCYDSKTAITVCGLALSLGMTRETLLTYQRDSQFSDTIKIAKAVVEESLERRLLGNNQVAGAIFNLKNNFGWKDKQEHEISGSEGGPLKGVIEIDFVKAPDPTTTET